MLTAVSLAVPVVRRMLRDKLLPIVRRGFSAIVTIGKSPTKLLLLVGGSVLVTLSYIVALFYATQAFGGDLSFARIGSIYLLGSTVAAAAPPVLQLFAASCEYQTPSVPVYGEGFPGRGSCEPQTDVAAISSLTAGTVIMSRSSAPPASTLP